MLLLFIFAGISVIAAITTVILTIHAKQHEKNARQHAQIASTHAQKAQELANCIKKKTPKRKIEEF